MIFTQFLQQVRDAFPGDKADIDSVLGANSFNIEDLPEPLHVVGNRQLAKMQNQAQANVDVGGIFRE